LSQLRRAQLEEILLVLMKAGQTRALFEEEEAGSGREDWIA
jgi:hypothetical protein